MDLHFIPRAKVIDHLMGGWTLVPGHEYRSDDFAILMIKPAVSVVVSEKEIRAAASQFEAKPRILWGATKSRAASIRNRARFAKVPA